MYWALWAFLFLHAKSNSANLGCLQMGDFWVKISLPSNITELDVREKRVINKLWELCGILQNTPFPPTGFKTKITTFLHCLSLVVLGQHCSCSYKEKT